VTLFGRPSAFYYDYRRPAVGYGGFPGNPADPHTVVRTMESGVTLPGGTGWLQTFGVVVARVSGLSWREISGLPPTTWIDFAGGAGTYPTVPLQAILAGTPTALANVRGKIVLLGITARIKHDVHRTSAPGRSTMAGTELQANAVATALRGFPLRSPGTLFALIVIAVLGLLPLPLGLRLSARRCLAAVVGLALAFVVAAQLAFDAGWVIDFVVPLATLLVSGLAVSAAIARASRRAPTPRPGAAGGAGAAGAAERPQEPVPAAY
jgi:hypothetical protein